MSERVRPAKVWRIDSLTSMRGIAATAVLFYHSWSIPFFGGTAAQSPPLWTNFMIMGDSGVGFFFVLSGYLLVRKWLNKDYTSLKEYFGRRVFRTFPLYYIIIAVATPLGLYLYHWQSLLFIQEYNPATFDSSIFWTLTVEEAFYLTLPLSMRLLFNTKEKTKLVAVSSVCFAVGFYLLTHGSYGTAFYVIPYWFVTYSFGALLAHGVKPIIGKTAATVLFGAVTLLVWMTPSPWIWGQTILHVSSTYLMYISATYSSLIAILYWVMIANFENSALLNKNRFLIYLGVISYSVYAWHPFILHWTRINLFPHPPMPLYWALIVGMIGMGAGALSYHTIEKPFMNLGRRVIPAHWKRKVRESATS